MVKKVMMLLMAMALPALALAGDQNPWDIKLPFKKATINYTISGMENGTETLYIRDYGKETAKYHKAEMNMMGMTKVNESIEFVDPEWIYIYDLQEQTGTKAVNPQKYMIEEYNKLTDAEKEQVIKNSRQIASGPMLGGMGGEIEEKATKILGYDCDRMSMMGTTVYAIHKAGLPLKTESNMMGMKMLIEATKIDKGEPPKKYFKHPEGITAVMDPDADAMARSMAKETMTMLKDPEAAEKASQHRPMMSPPRQQEMTPEEQQQMEQAMEALKNIFGN